ncbi:MAG: HAD family hydrolase [[Clostridium] scindens]
MVRGVIFDMDGLMFDTERLATVLWNQVGDELRIDMTEEFLDSFRGQNPTAIRNAFLQRFGREFDFDGCMGRKDELQHRYIEEKGVPLKEGLPELLEYLKGQDIRMAVATSTQQSLAEKMLKIAGVYEYFDAVAYGNKVKRSKPFSDIFQKAAEDLGVPMRECLVLEDSISGVQAGKAAGGYIIHIPDVVVVPEEVKDGITAELRSLRDVIDWIEHAN